MNPNLKVLEIDPTDKFHLTNIRNKDTLKEQLIESLTIIGQSIGRNIFNSYFTQETDITTPMSQSYKGILSIEKSIVIISTDADFDNYAKGIASSFKNCHRGYIDYGGKRGKEALQEEFRTLHLPEINKPFVDVLVVAKTVLATGCTAISITQNAIQKYKPRTVIIASVFYTQVGIEELITEFPHSNFLLIEEDQLNEDGMLLPGVGNLDKRLTA
jgi:uracil phosphoribosyltransferase